MNHSQKIWIIAGESSGDLYGAKLAEDLKRLAPETEIAGMGGARMRNAGVRLLVAHCCEGSEPHITLPTKVHLSKLDRDKMLKATKG